MIFIPLSDENTILLIRYMFRDGLDGAEIAKKLNISDERLNFLLKEDERLVKQEEYSRLLTDYAVEDALLKRALGSTSVETKETVKNSGVESVTVTKEIPSDTAALKFWLEHRRPERWAEKGESNQEVNQRLDAIIREITRQADEDGRKNELQ